MVRENRGLIMVRCSMKEYDDGKGKGLSERIKGMTPQGCGKKLHQVFWQGPKSFCFVLFKVPRLYNPIW